VTDSINISYSFQVGGTPATPANAPTPGARLPTYAYAECEQIMLNETTVVIVNVRSGGKMAVTRDVANALTYCLHYETLPDHARTICASVPMLRGQEADVLQILDTARKAGILLDAGDTAARIGDCQSAGQLAPTRVFIITCDRPAAIERQLDSLLGAGDLSRHDRLVLIDDSRKEDNIQRNRELVAAFNRNSATTMHYFGAQAASELLARLVQVLPGHEAGLRFLLDRQRWAGHPTYGLSRNLALLLSVGYRALLLDDDIVCRAVQPPRSQPGIGFRHEESREAWFYPSVPALLQSTSAADFNPLSRHADVVGQPLGAVLAALGGGSLEPDALAHCQGTMLSVLDGSSCVLMTQCGSAGDPGTVGSKWVTRLGAESVRRLLARSADNQSLPQPRPCWLGYTRPTIALRGDMSQLTGLDNSQLLPPYLPVLRGEDALFASMTTYLHPRSAVLNFDWAVLHLPLEDRSALDYDDPFTNRAHLGVLANYLLSKIDTRGCGTAESRLSSLAAEIRGLAEWDQDALLAQVALELSKGCATGITLLDTLLADTQSHQYPRWRAFLERISAQTREALLASGEVDGGRLGWVAPLRAAALEFAQALDAWSLIREQAAVVAQGLLASDLLMP
jgi:hypothetical protein